MGAKKRVIFILSELEYYSNIEKYRMSLNSLRAIGVMIAIDRVGSIHSSFLYLRDLDFDIIRFDTYYTKELKSREYDSIIDGFNIMAHKKGIKSWIKNIEDEETLLAAKELNIDYLQGRYLSDLEKIDKN
eukprot:NODE_2564_length_463_cov_500.084541_g2120_i0.p1 GENE.NODE_2564_length_463_cov_500.084541_g2120_i0~~NODE_2564_length_463_cov_500.084541_g2120_i0.p1  ORF type:complete len:138 (-),score=4.28 NODE_2564_length_463_cov_500.084541_g2120_i0:49-438(-)